MTTYRYLSFAGGELAPALHARVDTVKYATGLRTLRNCFIMRHGGVQNRSGTKFISEVKDHTKRARLIPFVFNSDQTYALEFSDLCMRVVRNGAVVSDLSLTITAITNADPAVFTYTGTDPANGDQLDISGVLGMTQVNNRRVVVSAVNGGANTFSALNVDGTNLNSSAFGVYTSGGTAARVYAITTPYEEANLRQLRFAQSADTMPIANVNYQPRELVRAGHASWSLSTISFIPSISAPTGLSGPAGSNQNYVVTAVKDETFEESLASSNLACGSAPPTPDVWIDISWNAVSGARSYNVYRRVNGIYGYVGPAGSTSFRDTGQPSPDVADTPPDTRNPFNGSTNWPATVNYIQQRLFFAQTTADPLAVIGSRTGRFHNYTISTPIQDDDAVKFSLAGLRQSRVLHLFDLDNLILWTEEGEFAARGNAAGVITPYEFNCKQQGYNGASSTAAPIAVGSTVLYVQARESKIRDLLFDYTTNGYRGNDLTIYSSHLFDGHEIVEWAYQQNPHSIVWCVRDDGVLLSLTYVREQELWGWARHDFDGDVESVCVIPEGNEDSVYLIVKRTINGATRRYIERIESRFIDDDVDNIFMDSALTYDGRHTGATTMTLSGGTLWTVAEELTLTASASTFTALDVGNKIFLTGSAGTVVRCTIVEYTSATVVKVNPHMTVPVAMRSAAISTWARAVDEVTGLWHLEGETVSVTGDSGVVASPNNPGISLSCTVTNGAITLDDCYAVIHVGIPYLSDIETLDIDTAQGGTIADRNKKIDRVNVRVQETRGVWAGCEPPEDDSTEPAKNLVELKVRSEEAYGDNVALATTVLSSSIIQRWNDNGRVFLRQIDPLPMTILSILPAGWLPFGRTV